MHLAIKRSAKTKKNGTYEPSFQCNNIGKPWITVLNYQDYDETAKLLSYSNVDQKALEQYTREAADFSTHRQLPNLEFAFNQYGQADVALFDFTCM